MKEKNKKTTNTKPSEAKKQESKPIGFDWVRVVLGILLLSILLSVSLDMINDKFASKQDELIEEEKDHLGWIVIVIGYTVPLVLACTVPMLMCVGSKKGEQRKHLIKALIIAGSAVFILLCVCPKRISDLSKQKEFCEMLEQKVKDEEDFVYPEDQPSVKEATLLLQRAVEWTGKAGIGLAVVGAYQGIRYGKLRRGEQDEDVPAEELDDDDLPDVDWKDRQDFVQKKS